jgi:hypothetical protein
MRNAPTRQQVLDPSPLPASEWPVLHRVLGPALLARLLHIPATSLHRFESGAPAPDDVIARLHALALMVGDLSGAYDNAGIRRWFVRPRTVLGNHAPADVLSSGWRPEDAGPRRVSELGRVLAA